MKFSAVSVLFALFSTALATPTIGNDLARRATCPLPLLCTNVNKCNGQNKICVVKEKKKDSCGNKIRLLVKVPQEFCDHYGYV